MAVYDDRAWAFMDGYVRRVLTAAPVLATVESVQMPQPFAAEALPTKTIPLPARALRHQRQPIGLITTAIIRNPS